MEVASDLTIDPDTENTTHACGTLSESSTTMANSFEVNENSDIYYLGSTYWNDLDVVQRRINERISGDPTRKWHEHLARQTGRTFKRALILNCGNGWVERELVEYGLIAEAVGMDYSQPLVEQAAAAAREAGLPLTYHRANVNTGSFPEGEFDLVVNHTGRAPHRGDRSRLPRSVPHPARGRGLRLVGLRGTSPVAVQAGRLGGSVAAQP